MNNTNLLTNQHEPYEPDCIVLPLKEYLYGDSTFRDFFNAAKIANKAIEKAMEKE